MKLAVIAVNVWWDLMAPPVRITSMTVCPTLVITTHFARMVLTITLVSVSLVSLCQNGINNLKIIPKVPSAEKDLQFINGSNGFR